METKKFGRLNRLYWINAFIKECGIVRTATVAHVITEHIPNLLFISYLQCINGLLEMRIETLSSFPQEAL